MFVFNIGIIMKRLFIFILSSVLLMGLSACQREQFGLPEKPLEFATFKVNLGQNTDGLDSVEATKSVVNFDAEGFQSAVLYAFYTYGGQQKCLYISAPGKSFEWDLPLRTEMDIYCLYNYGDLVPPSGSSAESNPGGTKTALESLVFTYKGQMSAFNDSGLPKAGITHITSSQLQTGSDIVTIKVKNLFAKFELKFNVSDYLDAGDVYSISSVGVYNMNKSVHYFSPSGGDAASSIESTVADFATASDLISFNNNGGFTLYVLENMQGEKNNKSDSWSDTWMYAQSADLSRCTYALVTVNISNAGNPKATYTTYAYLNNTEFADFPSTKDFNIKRNVFKSVVLPIKGGDVSIRFDRSSYVTRKNRTLNIPFYYKNVDRNTLSFQIDHMENVLWSVSYDSTAGVFEGSGILHISGFNVDAPLGQYRIVAMSGSNRGTTEMNVQEPCRLEIDAPSECTSGDLVDFTARVYVGNDEINNAGTYTWEVTNADVYSRGSFWNFTSNGSKASFLAKKSNLWYVNSATCGYDSNGNYGPLGHITTVPSTFQFIEVKVSCELNDGSGEVLTAIHKITINPLTGSAHVFIGSNLQGNPDNVLKWAETSYGILVPMVVHGVGADFTLTANQLKSSSVGGFDSSNYLDYTINSITFNNRFTLQPNNNTIIYYCFEHDRYYTIDITPIR